MKLIIAGVRDFDDIALANKSFNEMCSQLNTTLSKVNPVTEIVSSGARGADRIGEKIAIMYKIPIKQFIPDWNGL